MLDFTLPNLDIIAFLMAVSALVSWGGVEIFKKAIQGLIKSKKMLKEPWWYNATCRLGSCVLGFVTGYLFCNSVECGLIGFGAGALNTFIVMLVKSYAKKKING